VDFPELEEEVVMVAVVALLVAVVCVIVIAGVAVEFVGIDSA
jgi:hypothetical protein